MACCSAILPFERAGSYIITHLTVHKCCIFFQSVFAYSHMKPCLIFDVWRQCIWKQKDKHFWVLKTLNLPSYVCLNYLTVTISRILYIHSRCNVYLFFSNIWKFKCTGPCLRLPSLWKIHVNALAIRIAYIVNCQLMSFTWWFNSFTCFTFHL